MRLRVRYPDVASFKAEYETQLQRGESFVPTDKPLKVGTEMIFEILIGSDPTPVRIMGTVAWINRVKPRDVGDTPQGMNIKYKYNKAEIDRIFGSV